MRFRFLPLASPALLAALIIGGPALVSIGCGSDEPADVQRVPPGGARAATKSPEGRKGRGENRSRDPVAVAVAAATSGTIANYYSTTATLESLRQATVLARVSGVILETQAEEGDSVSSGDLLLRIQDDEFRLKARQANAEKARLQSKFDRAQRMAAGEFIAAEEVEVTEHELESAKASASLAQLELSFTRVTAPFSGHVVRRHVDAGQNVSNGTELYTLSDLSRLRAEVHVPAREFREIGLGQRVELTLDSTGARLEGAIALVSPIIDSNSGTVRVTIDITDYPPGSRPGDFAEVRIVTDEHSNAILVPHGAVITDGADEVVYVASPDSVAVRRVVTVGFEDEVYTEISAGIDEHELVVIQGQRSLKPKTPLTILPALEFGDASNDTTSLTDR